MTRAWLACAFALATASIAPHALALDGGAGHDGADERADLERQLAADYDSLSASDCATACKALASMERAVERICQLAPGKSCEDARTKLDDARRKVREQCPTCQVVGPREEHVVATAPAPGPASEAPHGGCASCTTTGARDLGGDGLLFAAALAFVVSRRRRVNRRAP